MTQRHESPSEFVRSSEGDCSFCGNQGWEVCALLKSASRSDRICNECVVLCLDVFSEMDDKREAVAAELGRLDSHRALREEFMSAMALNDVDGVVAVVGQMGRDVEPEAVRAWIRGEPDLARADFDFSRYQRPGPESCSFCGAAANEVGKLIKGPGVAICGRCVDVAATELLSALRT